LNLTDQAISDFVAASLRLRKPGPRVDAIGVPEVRTLSPALVDDFLAFFDNDAFAGNPVWASCYCLAHQRRCTDEEWAQRSAAVNRADMARLIETGETHGYLAYADGRPVGWCNASGRAAYPAYDRERGGGGQNVGAVVCFIIAPEYRRHGIARLLLDAACAGLRERGFATVEGYPARVLPPWDGAAYHGRLSMFLDAGFQEVGETERYVVMEKRL
jgi:GNAT superfamily N-acetyltransferase